MSILLTIWPIYTLADHVACCIWWVTVSMPLGQTVRTDGLTPNRYITVSLRRGQRKKT